MFIKKIEVSGFKSFKDKTSLEFENHEMTGIVGPNGCGKSNVVDALLWVMGETSPKNLRGDKLVDVIFSGTATQTPGNVAEVCLTLEKGDTGFPENYKDFNELSITRRAYRDGENQYLINNEACLQRDIHEFFMNTGAGRRGFSIVEQEAIEKLITAKPLQRRFIIEETAGITKFKTRKIESIKKLNLVNHNLERLNDILKTQEQQLKDLSSQAKKAERYKKIKEEKDIMEAELTARKREDLFIQFKTLKKQEETLREKKEEIALSKKELEKTIEKDNETIKDLEEKLNLKKQSETEKKISRASLADKIKLYEMMEIVTRIKSQESSLREKEKEKEEIKEEIEKLNQGKKEAEIYLLGLEEQKQIIEKELDPVLKEVSEIQKDLQSSLKEKKESSSLLKTSLTRTETLKPKLEALKEQEEKEGKQKEKLEVQYQDLNREIKVLEDVISEKKDLIKQFSKINQARKELEEKSEDYETLFQNLKIEEGFEKALSSLLGPHCDALVPLEELGIEHALELLGPKKGAVSFLSRLSSSFSSSKKAELKKYPAVTCFLSSKVKPSYKAEALNSLLENTAVVNSLKQALDLKKKFPDFFFVTQKGDLITKEGFVSTGENQGISFISKQFQLEEQEGKLSKAKIQAKALKIDLQNSKAQEAELKKQIEKLEAEAEEIKSQTFSLEKKKEALDKDIIHFSEIKKRGDEKVSTLKDKKQGLEEAISNQKRKTEEEFEQKIKEKQDRINILSQELEKSRQDMALKTKIEKELLSKKKEQSELLGEDMNLFFDFSSKKSGEQGLSQSVDWKKKVIDLKKEEEENRLKETEILEEIEVSSKELEGLKESLKSCTTKLHEKDIEKERTLSEIEKKGMEKEHLKASFKSICNLDIEEFELSRNEEDPIPLDELKKKLETYERRIEQMSGGINFLALEEYEKLSKESFFLNEQKEDLVQSKKEISKVITHIDKLCDTRFSDMLEEINKRFQKVFPLIFHGDNAEAKLLLQEGAEGEEHGVDILIRPPGKRPQSVSLLSRGEKALTAISLIYSLFLVKPSPFCIIDEADAPLDDANIYRFISVLKEMTRKSQIIVITHNKYTMQACKKLYGVTMKQPGVSQIVSVDLKRLNEATKRV